MNQQPQQKYRWWKDKDLAAWMSAAPFFWGPAGPDTKHKKFWAALVLILTFIGLIVGFIELIVKRGSLPS